MKRTDFGLAGTLGFTLLHFGALAQHLTARRLLNTKRPRVSQRRL